MWLWPAVQAQQHLSEGHHAMTMKSGAFQYSYRLWVEDMEGFELPFNHDQPFIAQRCAFSPTIIATIIATLSRSCS